MAKTDIIGFHGPAGSGKDTCGRYLIEQYGFKKISFAGPLKAMLAALGYPEPPTLEEKERTTDMGVTYRWMAQSLGTQWGRELVNPDIWMIAAQRTMEANPGKYVFTDVRFENEARLIRDMGGVIVHIQGRRGDVAASTAAHVSERGLVHEYGDFTLYNGDDGIDVLEARLAMVLHPVL